MSYIVTDGDSLSSHNKQSLSSVVALKLPVSEGDGNVPERNCAHKDDFCLNPPHKDLQYNSLLRNSKFIIIA